MNRILKSPPIYEWMDEEEIDFRNNAIDLLSRALNSYGYTPVNISFFQDGEASLTALVEIDSKSKIVAKFSNKEDSDLAAEQEFYTIVGKHISVPRPLDLFEYESINFSLIEFIPHPTLSSIKKIEIEARNLYFEYGKLIYQLHNIPIIEEGKIEFAEKYKYNSVDKEVLINNIAEVSTTSTLVDSRLKVQILDAADQLNLVPELSFIHNDLNASNVFVGDRMTLFDPYAAIGISYLDIGKAFTYLIKPDIEPTFIKQLYTGYTSESEGIDEGLLLAGLRVSAITKILTAQRRNDLDRANKIINLVNKFESYLSI